MKKSVYHFKGRTVFTKRFLDCLEISIDLEYSGYSDPGCVSGPSHCWEPPSEELDYTILGITASHGEMKISIDKSEIGYPEEDLNEEIINHIHSYSNESESITEEDV